MGLAQVMQVFFGLMCYSMFAPFLYGMSFLELMPKLLCTENGVEFECDTDDICEGTELKPGVEFRVDYSDSLSLHNWVQELDMYCYSDYQIGLFGSMYFFGYAISSLLIKFSDWLGRL